MQVKSKNSVRTVKLDKRERQALATASNLCSELSQLADGDVRGLAAKAEQALDAVMETFEPSVVAE